MRIAVVGAGGVGGYFGALLARAGHEVRFLARGEHGRAIRERGLEVREPGGETWRVAAAASEDAADLTPAEYAILAVKSYSVVEVAPALVHLASEGAVVVPVLNGVEAYETLASLGVPKERLLAGLAVISVDRSAPGVVTRHSAFRRIVVGERPGGRSDRAERLAAALREAGAEANASDDIASDLWRKFLFLSTIAAACGLSRASIGAVRDAPGGLRLIGRLLSEAAATGRARGVSLPESAEATVRDGILGLAAHLKPSFLLDLERGGPTELDVLSGAIVRYGRETGVPTPIHETASAAFAAATSGHPSAETRPT
jgi:2-dehydropantoate 2-reductase